VSNPTDWVRLAELSQAAVDSRRGYEWRVNFSLWAALALTAYYGRTDLDLRISSMCWKVTLGLFIIALYALFQQKVHVAHETDKRFKHYYLDRAEGKEKPRNPELPKWYEFDWRWAIPPVGFTALLVFEVLSLL